MVDCVAGHILLLVATNWGWGVVVLGGCLFNSLVEVLGVLVCGWDGNQMSGPEALLRNIGHSDFKVGRAHIHIKVGTSCYAIDLPGRSSGFRAEIRPGNLISGPEALLRNIG